MQGEAAAASSRPHLRLLAEEENPEDLRKTLGSALTQTSKHAGRSTSRGQQDANSPCGRNEGLRKIKALAITASTKAGRAANSSSTRRK